MHTQSILKCRMMRNVLFFMASCTRLAHGIVYRISHAKFHGKEVMASDKSHNLFTKLFISQ